MPIDIDPTPISIPAPPTIVQANRLHIDDLHVDPSGEVLNLANAPRATIVTRLYAEDVAGNRTYADTTDVYTTRNLYVACVNIPEMAAALQAVFVAVKAWQVYREARQAELDTVQIDLLAKQAMLSVAQDDLQAAQTADDAESTPDTQKALADAQKAFADVQAAELTAEQNVAIASAARDDPANPKFVPAQ